MKTSPPTVEAVQPPFASRRSLAPSSLARCAFGVASLALAGLAAHATSAAPNESWSFVGPQGMTPGQAITGDIEVDGRGRLYTSYKALFRTDTHASVRVWNVVNQSWDLVGPEGSASAGNAWYNDLAFTRADDPLICHRDYSLLGAAGVRIFADGQWTSLPQVSPGHAHYTRMTLARNSTPVVVYQDFTTDPPDATTVRYFERASQSWRDLGSPGILDATSGYQSIAANANGIPYIAFTSEGHGGRVCVLRYDVLTGSWQGLGSPLDTSEPGVHHAELAFDRIGRLHVAYAVWHERIEVKRWDGVKWERLGSMGGASEGDAPVLETEHWRQWLSLVFDSQNRPHVAYELEDNGRPVVRRYDEEQDRWPSLGPAPFYDAQASYMRMTIGHDDTVYVAFSDGAVSGAWSVMQYR